MTNLWDKYFIYGLFLLAFCTPLIVMAWVVHGLSGGSEEFWPLLGLFALPPLAQLIGACALHIRVQSENEVKKFYRFYLSWMFLNLLSYPGVWLLFNEQVNWQWLPLVLVVLLTIPVGGMTYTIMGHAEKADESPNNATQSTEGKDSWKQWPKEFIDHCILLEDMRDSVSRAPFWAFLLFFTMLLVITYLFSFAFAFHDRACLEEGKLPSLYMVKAYDDERGNPDDKGKDYVAHSISAPPVEYKFFFESGGPNLEGDSGPFRDDSPSKRDKEKNKLWKRHENLTRLNKLVEAIKEGTKNNGSIALVLSGQADSKRSIGDSNYDISQNRVSHVMAAITQRLSDNTKRSIELLATPLGTESNELPTNESSVIDISRMKKTLGDKFDQLDLDDKNRINAERDVLNSLDLLERLDIPKDEQLSNKDKQHLLGELEKILDYLRSHRKDAGQDNASKEAMKSKEESKREDEDRKREREAQITRLKALVNEAWYAGGEAGRRVVVVTLKRHEKVSFFQPFSLLAYIAYTITGPTYGSVIPRTSYAKFLCAFADIIQLFFVVALLSAILSLKKTGSKADNEGVEWKMVAMSGPICKISYEFSRNPSERRELKVEVEAPDEYVWKVETTENWVIPDKPSGKGKETIVFRLLQNDTGGERNATVTIGSTIFNVKQRP